MVTITAAQLAELLVGIGRAQAAMVHGIENAMPGTRANHITPAVQTVARLRDHPSPHLADLPARILLSFMGRQGPDVAAIERELERLLTGDEAVHVPPAPNESAPSPDATTTLDFSRLQPGRVG